MGGLHRRHGFWAAVAALAASVFLCGESVRIWLQRRRDLIRLEERLASARDRVLQREARLARAEKDDMFVETAARRELGLLREGEIEFRFVEREEPLPPRTEVK